MMEKLLMLKLLMIVGVLGLISCDAKTDVKLDDKVMKFEETRILSSTNLKIKTMTVHSKKELPLKGWTGYVLSLELLSPKGDFATKDTLYTDGSVVVMDLYDIKTATNYKEFMAPELSSKHYTKEHLIAGKLTAKHKVAVFSDPLCPACIPYLPGLIDEIKAKKDTALYYIHLPLQSLHPAAMTITKAMIKLEMDGSIDGLTKKIYQANFSTEFDSRETDSQKILDGVNKKLGTKLTLKEINTKAIQDKLDKDLQLSNDMGIQGTPTIYVDGKQDRTRSAYKKFK